MRYYGTRLKKEIKNITLNRNQYVMLSVAIILILFLVVAVNEISDYDEETPPPEGFEVSSGWTVTSYYDVNEALYDGEKIEVFDSHGNSLGFYKSDFLEQLRIDGAGKGDGIQNSGKYLHYDYRVDDGKTYYLVDKSVGAWGNELVPWTGEEPSIAVNPPVPYGTLIRFKDLGPEGENYPDWVIELLKTKTFFADDTFFLKDEKKYEKKIDIYVGLQKMRDASKAQQSILMHDVTIYIKYPE